MKLLKRLIIASGIIFLLLFVFLATTVFVVKNLRIKELIEYELEQELDINVTIKDFSFSPLLTHVTATGVTVYNPKGFEGGELAYINSLSFDVDPIEAVVRRKPQIYLFMIDIERLNVMRNAKGKINIKEIIPQKDDVAASEAKTPFFFDVAVLSINQVNFIDHKSGRKKEYHYPVRIKNATFIGLKNGSEVVNLIIFEALKYTEVGKLVNMTVVPVFSQVNNTMSAAWGMTQTGAKSAWEILSMPFHLITGH